MLSDQEVIERVFEHIDAGTTDRGDEVWLEPTEHYRSEDRFQAELALMRQLPMPFAPSLALENTGDYIARPLAGIPILVVRHEDGGLRAYRNACRHRGVTVAEGSGCTRVFSCRYHGWAYNLDGELTHVPHESGFPGLDKATNGLVPVHGVTEQSGLVFVSIEDPIDAGALVELPDLIGHDQAIFARNDGESEFNWKLNIEATLEGYHIKPTHRESFYPYGYDNLNVVETFGPNARVTFPFRRIEKLRAVPPAERDIRGMVTYAYNIFPTASVAMLSNHTAVSFSEPLSPTRTHYYSYRIGQRVDDPEGEAAVRMRRDASFVADTGSKEDAEMVQRIQKGLASGANTHFTYGHFERAITNFHRSLTERLAQTA
ncbi:MAG: aromatic ring-hydroxylating dioxygenase subunit alpha [Pseudomonadota bacterium]